MKLRFFNRSIVIAFILVATIHSHAIRNGDPVQLGHFSGVGRLNLDCTASLIAPNVILTALHCLDLGLADPTQYVFTTDEGQEASGIKIAYQGDGTRESMVLIKLSQGLNSSSTYPLCQKKLNAGTLGVAVGYGELGEGLAEAGFGVPNKKRGEIEFELYSKKEVKLINSPLVYGGQTLAKFKATSKNQMVLPFSATDTWCRWLGAEPLGSTDGKEPSQNVLAIVSQQIDLVLVLWKKRSTE